MPALLKQMSRPAETLDEPRRTWPRRCRIGHLGPDEEPADLLGGGGAGAFGQVGHDHVRTLFGQTDVRLPGRCRSPPR